MKINKKMLIIELNEFCPNHLEEIAKRLNLKYLEKIFNLNHTKTYTNELKEFQGLDPWVQWVSIHNGIPLKKHRVKRLGDISKIQNTHFINLILMSFIHIGNHLPNIKLLINTSHLN